MRLVSFSIDGRDLTGAVAGDVVMPIAEGSLRQLIETSEAHELAAATVKKGAGAISLDKIVWRPVVPDLGKIICVGLNYHEHVVESQRDVAIFPSLFPRYPETQIGHLEPLVRPRISEQFDYEGELAVIIGHYGHRLHRKNALSHVFGYSCYNDATIRDWQRHTSQFLPGKNFVATGAFGPWCVTVDELGDAQNLQIATRLNSELVQNANTRQMITDIADQIAYISAFVPLSPGDVIVTGTPGGVGCRRSPPLYLKPSDTVEVEIEGIGVLRNGVVTEPESQSPEPGFARKAMPRDASIDIGTS
jgi:2-keto-4-pentenoate hydratase/2-oxohepta-3-ene-1,7-dioic acid hydratase in catechol pathway